MYITQYKVLTDYISVEDVRPRAASVSGFGEGDMTSFPHLIKLTRIRDAERSSTSSRGLTIAWPLSVPGSPCANQVFDPYFIPRIAGEHAFRVGPTVHLDFYSAGRGWLRAVVDL